MNTGPTWYITCPSSHLFTIHFSGRYLTIYKLDELQIPTDPAHDGVIHHYPSWVYIHFDGDPYFMSTFTVVLILAVNGHTNGNNSLDNYQPTLLTIPVWVFIIKLAINALLLLLNASPT